jgi:hypothetical protein
MAHFMIFNFLFVFLSGYNNTEAQLLDKLKQCAKEKGLRPKKHPDKKNKINK